VFVRCFYGSAPGNRFSYRALRKSFWSAVEGVHYCRFCICEGGASLSLRLCVAVASSSKWRWRPRLLEIFFWTNTLSLIFHPHSESVACFSPHQIYCVNNFVGFFSPITFVIYPDVRVLHLNCGPQNLTFIFMLHILLFLKYGMFE
jgi:hypothetical protein